MTQVRPIGTTPRLHQSHLLFPWVLFVTGFPWICVASMVQLYLALRGKDRGLIW